MPKRIFGDIGRATGRDRGSAVELTDLTCDRRRWWTLGFEAIGPAEALTYELNASVARMFNDPLPAGLILDIAHSTSYPEWLSGNWRGVLAPTEIGRDLPNPDSA